MGCGMANSTYLSTRHPQTSKRARTVGALALVLVPAYFMPFAVIVEDLLILVLMAGKAVMNGILGLLVVRDRTTEPET
jgi:hypothetical protein